MAARKKKKVGGGKKRRAAGARAAAPETLGAEIESLERIARLMEEHGLAEVEVQSGDHMVRVSRRVDAVAAPPRKEPSEPPPSSSVEAPPPEEDADLVEFTSPLVGTFYRAPNPESAPYVVPGDKVEEETILCIIEAMKVMNEIKAEMKGEIVDILVENGEAVEFGQPLFLIRKTA